MRTRSYRKRLRTLRCRAARDCFGTTQRRPCRSTRRPLLCTCRNCRECRRRTHSSNRASEGWAGKPERRRAWQGFAIDLACTRRGWDSTFRTSTRVPRARRVGRWVALWLDRFRRRACHPNHRSHRSHRDPRIRHYRPRLRRRPIRRSPRNRQYPSLHSLRCRPSPRCPRVLPSRPSHPIRRAPRNRRCRLVRRPRCRPLHRRPRIERSRPRTRRGRPGATGSLYVKCLS